MHVRHQLVEVKLAEEVPTIFQWLLLFGRGEEIYFSIFGLVGGQTGHVIVALGS